MQPATPVHSLPKPGCETRWRSSKDSSLKAKENAANCAFNLQLRRKLEKAAAEHSRGKADEHTSDRNASEDSEELEAGIPSRSSTLIPVFRNAARDSLRSAPAHISRQALQAAADLAAGDLAAWSGIKRLRRVPDVWSARITACCFALTPAVVRWMSQPLSIDATSSQLSPKEVSEAVELPRVIAVNHFF